MAIILFMLACYAERIVGFNVVFYNLETNRPKH